MESKELHRILARGEGLRIEFKEAQNGVSDTLYDTVSSFLNREGGIIILGVDDDGNVVTALNNPDVINPPFAQAFNELIHENNTLLYIRGPVSSFIHKHAEVIYDRENDSDFRITDEARISAMYARKRNVFTENQIFPNLRIEDLPAP